MIRPENFVSRWSRLKRGCRNRKTTPAAPLADAAEPGVAVERQGAAASPGTEAPTSGGFDPASLPSIDAITADTDIRLFMQSGVPAKLMQAALRRMWACDAAIRDFIGIAESQWDLTDPTAMPGFGPLRETDDVPRLLAQALGSLPKVPEAIDAEISDPVQVSDLVQVSKDRAVTAAPGDTAADGEPRRLPRRQGSALPR